MRQTDMQGSCVRPVPVLVCIPRVDVLASAVAVGSSDRQVAFQAPRGLGLFPLCVGGCRNDKDGFHKQWNITK